MRDLSRIAGRLHSLGLSPLLEKLTAGQVDESVSLPFRDMKTAKATQALLYNWLWFFPNIKGRISLRLDEDTLTLLIMPKGKEEKRGRRRIE